MTAPATGFWRQLLNTIARNPISLFAVLCVSCTAAYLGWLTYRLMLVLESPAWCAKAIQAEKVSPGSTYVGLTTCVELLKIQLQAVATGFHISTGGFVFVLIVLIVVVVAGARASGKLGSSGLEFDMSRQDAATDAAKQVAGAAAEKKDEIVAEGKP
jgi:hypothetical protein